MRQLATLNEARRYKDIVDICNELLVEDVGDTDAYGYLGTAYMGLEEWGKAKKPLEYGLSIGADSGWFKYLLGVISLEIGEYKKAINWFKGSLEVREHPDPKIGLAQAYMKLGKEKEALELISQDPLALHNLTNWADGTKY